MCFAEKTGEVKAPCDVTAREVPSEASKQMWERRSQRLPVAPNLYYCCAMMVHSRAPYVVSQSGITKDSHSSNNCQSKKLDVATPNMFHFD